MSRRHARDALAVLGLALLVLAFFWPLLSGRYFIPRGGGDLVSFLWPTWQFGAESLREGVMPLWNPTLYAGAPFAADNQSALFYPVNLLVFLIGGPPTYGTMEGLVVFHLILAGALMFLLLRDKGLAPSPSAFGGLAFALADPFITHIGNLNLNATIAYLPALILAADRAFTRRSPGWALGAGAVLAVAAFAGHGQMLLFMGLTLALLAAYRLALSARHSARAAVGVGGLALLVATAGILCAAVALYPNYEFVSQTPRAALSWEEATRFSIPWRALVGLIAPGLYGRGPAGFWGPWDRVEVGYVGVLTLALAAGGIFAARKRRGAEATDSRFPLGFFALMALVGFALALGERTPLYGLLHRLPGFTGTRAPARFVFLADFGLAGLAAYGLQRVRSDRRAQIAGIASLVVAAVVALLAPRVLSVPPEHAASAQQAAIVAAALAGVGLLWALGTAFLRNARWLGAVAVLILAADLIVTGSTVEIDQNDPTVGFQQDDVVAFLRNDPGLFRIDSSASGAWQPDAAAVYGLYDINGVPNPLNLAIYEAYRWSIAARGDTLHSLLGVKYVLSDKGSPPGDERLVPVYTEGRNVDVYLNTRAYPMAQLVYDAVAAKTAEEAWAAIHAPDFDPSEVVFLQGQAEPLHRRGDGPAELYFTEYEANRLSLRVSTPAPAYLLLSEVYYPGWQAAVDGQSVEVLQADYLFRAVYVPAGDHDVRLWFAPRSVCVGLAVSAVAWLALCVLAIRAFRRQRLKREAISL